MKATTRKTTKTHAPVTTETPSFKPAQVGVYTVRERLNRIHRRAVLAQAAMSIDPHSEEVRKVLPATSRLMHEVMTEVYYLKESLVIDAPDVLKGMAPTEEDRVCAARGEIEVYPSEDYAFEF